MWRPTVIPIMDFGDEEPSVEPYSDAECHEGNHDRAADNHAWPNVLDICGAGHDQVQSSSHHSRLKIALAAENATQIYEKHVQIIPTLISIIFSLKTPQLPNAGNKELNGRDELMRKATILSGETPFSCSARTYHFLTFVVAYSSASTEIALR